MRSQALRLTFLVLATTAFVGLAPISSGDVQAPPAGDRYEIKNADRGPVKRWKVLLNGRKIATLVMSKGRTKASSFCCTAEGCKEVEVEASCPAFKMTCDKDGACSAT